MKSQSEFKEEIEMKKVLGTMVAMFLLIAWPFGGIWVVLFSKIIGGGVAEGYLYPIYAGIILLAGIIVCCTVIVCEEIKELKRKLDGEHESEV